MSREERQDPFEAIAKGLKQVQTVVTTFDQGMKVIDDMAKRIDDQFGVPQNEPAPQLPKSPERPPAATKVYGAEAKTYKGQTDVDYCIECLTGTTKLYTGNSTVKISSILDKHTVIGHTGQVESIDNVISRDYDGPLVELKFAYTNIPLYISPEHPAYIVRNVRKPQSTWREEGIQEKDLDWVPCEELTDRDFIAFPRIREIKDVEIASERLMELSGIYIAEGSPDKQERGLNVIFSFGRDEVELIGDTVNLIENIYGITPCVTDTETQTAVRVIFSSKYYGPYFEQFGKGAKNKTIPQWVLYLPEYKQVKLLRGAFRGDGSPGEYCFRYTTVSEQLAYRLRLLLFRLGILHGVYEREKDDSEINGRKIKGGTYYEITISGDAARQFAEITDFEYDGGEKTAGNHGYVTANYVFIPIKEARKIHFKGKLYNLHVPGSESYLTIHGALHNCAVKHSQTAKVLMREALQRAESNGVDTEGVKEKVRGVVEELSGLEDDTTTVSSQQVIILNGASRDLRKFIYESRAEIGGAKISTLREIKTMIDQLVEATYKVRETEECIGCTTEQICGGIAECVDFVDKNVEGIRDPAVIRKVLAEARRKYGRE